MYSTLLAIHVAAGFISLTGGFASAATKALPVAHGWHKRFGRLFLFGMCGVLATALPMTVLRPNLFLLMITLGSIYLAATGWRSARNRNGIPSRTDYALAAGILIVSVAAVAKGVTMLLRGDSMGWVMCVTFVVGTILGLSDLRKFRAAGARGHERVARHALRMMLGTIGALTAFVVTNFRVDPYFVLWLAPLFLLGPLALWWSFRIKTGASKYEMQ